MGDPLAQEVFDAFCDELIKEAFNLGQAGRFVAKKLFHPIGALGRSTGNFFGGIQEAGGRLLHPIKGLETGYQHMSPAYRIAKSTADMGFKSPAEAVKTLTSRAEKARKAVEAAKATGDKGAIRSATTALGEAEKSLGTVQFGGKHLLAPSQTLSEAARTPGLMAKSRAVAEELSRRGITGAGGPGVIGLGGATKYLPVGEKGQTALIAASMIPQVTGAKPATPTGEGGAMEEGGKVLGGLGGMVLGGGLGFVPAVGTWMASEYAGGRLGRILDRVRSGGTAGQALLAPSPEQAESQMAQIQKYYG